MRLTTSTRRICLFGRHLQYDGRRRIANDFPVLDLLVLVVLGTRDLTAVAVQCLSLIGKELDLLFNCYFLEPPLPSNADFSDPTATDVNVGRDFGFFL